jgi:hypothetical protein
VGGKSLRWIGFLQDVRRFLVSWHLRAGRSGEIRRLDRKSQGTVARELLEHLNGLKDDRLKTLADLIVQTARGLRFDSARREWVQVAEPVPLILFEDLSRYRFKTDRTPRENDQLMKWCHRGLIEVVQQQAELFGIGIATVDAAFSSRYSGRTVCPGIRCRSVRREDLEQAWFREAVERDGLRFQVLSVGDLIPWPGGEWFVSRSADGRGLEVEQADLNAARSIARRFLTRQAEAFRLRAAVEEAQGRAVALGWGKILAGAFGMASAELALSRDGKGWVGTLREARASRAAKEVPDGSNDSDDTADDEMEEAGRGKAQVFFRDPSGLLLPENEWRDARSFWGRVKTMLLSDLRRKGRCHG